MTSDDGRVEICIGGAWGSVCDDRWDQRDAEVVCNQLQYNGRERCSSSVAMHSCMNVSPSASYPLLSHGGRSLRPFYLDDVDCNGTESMLIHCGYGAIGVHNCNQGEEAGVICTSWSSLSIF